MNIGERINYLRKELSRQSSEKITLEKFGEKIGVKKSTLSSIENGTANPSTQLCKSNESWLVDGEGEPFLKKTRSEEISEFIKQIEIEDDTFKSDLILLLSQLSTAEWELLEKMAKKLAGTGKDSVQDTSLEDKSVQELEEIYKKEVLPELSGSDLTASPTTEGIA